jgi:hypothetical protein
MQLPGRNGKKTPKRAYWPALQSTSAKTKLLCLLPFSIRGATDQLKDMFIA